MPIQFSVYERRDNGDRDEMAKAALEICRISRKTQGITSARYYWTGDSIAFITEGESTAINKIATTDQKNYYRAAFILMDNTRTTLNLNLQEPREAVQMRDDGR